MEVSTFTPPMSSWCLRSAATLYLYSVLARSSSLLLSSLGTKGEILRELQVTARRRESKTNLMILHSTDCVGLYSVETSLCQSIYNNF